MFSNGNVTFTKFPPRTFLPLLHRMEERIPRKCSRFEPLNRRGDVSSPEVGDETSPLRFVERVGVRRLVFSLRNPSPQPSPHSYLAGRGRLRTSLDRRLFHVQYTSR